MRFLFILGLLMVAFTAQPFAQEQSNGRTYYGTPRDSGSGSIYLRPGTSTSVKPLSIPQILRGQQSTSSASSYYGGQNYRPFGVDNSAYSLSLSPQEVRESRARRDREARLRERNSFDEVTQASYGDTLDDQTAQFRNQFQSGPTVGRQPTQQRRVYRKREKGFETPPKVFNSIY